ncbi:hypothetical protein ElyMa_006473300 [Elysia marginata]|uniref:Uncharacterized protein n=1 Tax=Elysia marginata TaxID=1093978 RepID=A0AAV4I3G5_9GAST|nr:hypothetical protein ElyMa_006473300 [Elysia marginata]
MFDGYHRKPLPSLEPQSLNLDDCYTSSEEFHSGDQSGADKTRSSHNGHPYRSESPGSGHQPQVFVDFEDFVLKFNVIVRALVDAAKAVEKKAGEEKVDIDRKSKSVMSSSGSGLVKLACLRGQVKTSTLLVGIRVFIRSKGEKGGRALC